MWIYEKKLQYPVKITNTNPRMAEIITSQFGGPDGELGAAMRYLSQRYTMPYKEATGILTDIGIYEVKRMNSSIYTFYAKKMNNNYIEFSDVKCYNELIILLEDK